jgi:hypothetical protein
MEGRRLLAKQATRQKSWRRANSITLPISGRTCTRDTRNGTCTNVTETTMQTNTKPLEGRSDAVEPGWIFVCPELLLLAHGLINCNWINNHRQRDQQPMDATNNIWQKNSVSVLTPDSSTRRHQQNKTVSTNKFATLAKYPIDVMVAV